MKVTYYGHSCFAIETKGKIIVTDPFISPNPLAKSIDVNAIQADYIAVSHGHEDHVADLVAVAVATIVASIPIVRYRGIAAQLIQRHASSEDIATPLAASSRTRSKAES